MLDYDSGKMKSNIKPYVTVLDDNPIIRIVDEDEIMFLTKVGKDYLGQFLTSTGDICQKSNLAIQDVKGIKDILATSKHIIVLLKNHWLLVYTKTDVSFLQTIKIPNTGNYFFLSTSMDEVFVCSRLNVYYLHLKPYEAQIKECLEKCKGREALSIFDCYHSSTYKDRDLRKMRLNYEISWAYLEKKMYNEAQESFKNSDFDPIELLEKEFPDYCHDSMINNRQQNYYKKEALNFLVSVFLKKRQMLLKEFPNPEQENIKMTHLGGTDVKASIWLEYIDYALIKCMIEMGQFKELANFFKSSVTLYCGNIKEEIEV